MGIHDTFDDKANLAKAYAEDGAFRSAAKVLRELASELESHAKWCRSLLEEGGCREHLVAPPATDDEWEDYNRQIREDARKAVRQ